MPLSQPYSQALEHGLHHRRFAGSFAPNGSSGVSAAAGAIRGTGFTVTRIAAGQFRIKPEVPFKQLVACKIDYQGLSADTTPTTLNLGDVDPPNGNIDILIYQGGAKADITASGVARRINFEFILSVNDSLGTGATA